MTPQERQLIDELFDRLANLESTPRDPDAERAIAAGLARAPHAIYPLVQTVLVQDEALKVANAHIEELENSLGGSSARPTGGFLDNMRDALLGRPDEAPRSTGSVPSVRPAGSPWGNTTGYRIDAMAQGSSVQPPMAAPTSYGGGGSFLGTAAAAAAGMIGGGLMLGGIRSMLGGQQHGPFTGAFDHLSSGRGLDDGASPGGGHGSDDLARQAGLDDIGRSGSGGAGQDRAAGLFDSAQNEADDDGDLDDGIDDGMDDGGDTDVA